MKPALILISGPTGTGKSLVAVRVAERLGGEIVNADSIQIYRGLDIGSAKPSPSVRKTVPHHLYDRLDPDEHLDVASWTAMADGVIEEISARGGVPIIVGGTNFYLRALLRGLPELPSKQPELRRRLERILSRPHGSRHLHRLVRRIDPESGERIEPSDRHRIERAIEVYAVTGKPISSFPAPTPDDPARYPHILFALELDRAELRGRLDARVETMYESGLIEEVREILKYNEPDVRPLSSIGYREAVELVLGRTDYDTAVETTKRRTRAYARRQMTWLRAERDVQWVDAAAPLEETVESIVSASDRFLRTSSLERENPTNP